MRQTHACPLCGAELGDDGRVALDVATGIVMARGGHVTLTQAEMAIFEALWTARPRVASKERLLAASARGYGEDERETKTIDVFIHKLRRKVGALGIGIETVWGQGYRATEGSGHG